MAKVITADELKDYLGIDYADDMVERNINRAINTADMYLVGSLGNNYPAYDPRVKELALLIAGDLYDNRTLTAPANANVRKLVDDLHLQLRMEIRRKYENL